MSQRVQPHNIEAELAVLGSLLISQEALDVCVGLLKPYDFFGEQHQLIYQTIVAMSAKGQSVDILTLTTALRVRRTLEKVGGVSAVANLAEQVPSAANVEYYARIVKDVALRRHVIDASTRLILQAYEDGTDSAQLVEDAERRIFEIAEDRTTKNYQQAFEVVTESMERVMQRMKTKEVVTGIPTGFRELDLTTTGLHESEFIIIAARPSIGKTTFALNMAAHQAVTKKIPVGFLSLEMPNIDLMDRILASEARIDSAKLRNGFLRTQDLGSLRDIIPNVNESPLFMEDSANMKLLDLRAQARRMKSKNDIQILYVDYISLIGHENQRLARHEQVADISRSLKALARELKIPIVAMSQLTRVTEEKKMPGLADLRESGSLEQDADLVIFLHRNRDTDRDTGAAQASINTDLFIGKNRKGPVGKVELSFFPQFTRFESRDRDSN